MGDSIRVKQEFIPKTLLLSGSTSPTSGSHASSIAERVKLRRLAQAGQELTAKDIQKIESPSTESLKAKAAFRGCRIRATLKEQGASHLVEDLLNKDQQLQKLIFSMQKKLGISKSRGSISYPQYLQAMEKLKGCLEEFKGVDQDLKLYLSKHAQKDLRQLQKKYSDRLSKIEKSLFSISKSYGGLSLKSLMAMHPSCQAISKDFLGYDLSFHPTEWKEVTTRLNRKEQIHPLGCSQEVFMHALTEKKPFFTHLQERKECNPYDLVHGASLVIPISESQAVVVQGHFSQDLLGAHLIHDELRLRKESFAKALQREHSLPEDFRDNFLEFYSTTKDLVVLSDEEWISLARTTYEKAEKLEESDFTLLPGKFLQGTTEKKLEVISLLLLLDDDEMAVYFQSMLSEVSPQQARWVFDSLPYAFQEKLKSAQINYEKTKERLTEEADHSLDLEARVIASGMDERVKSLALIKARQAKVDTEEGAKAKKWVESLLKLPLGEYTAPPVSMEKNSPKEIADYMQAFSENLDSAVYGHELAKKQLMRVMGQWIANGGKGGEVIAIQGPPGNGKTTLAREGIAKALGRPFAFIAIGGAQDGATLVGHDQTYIGAKWGKIAQILMESKTMNPVIYIDELDKISQTERGKEIIGILTHLMDSSQNKEFEDVYFDGVKLDLSRALFVCSYNDEEKIDSILQDRMITIRTKGHSKEQKVEIAQQHLLPNILSNVSMKAEDIVFSEEIINYLIDKYTHEAGVRRLKECLVSIVREVNLNRLQTPGFSLPVIVDRDLVHQCLEEPRIQEDHVSDTPQVGAINGLYADTAGGGGLTVIQAFRTLAETHLALHLTGNQGKVMKESMQAARTVAWNLLPKELQVEIRANPAFGLHVHTPEAAVPKDGPSAGGAITTSIVSQLTGIPIRPDVATTGEIDLSGNIKAIGGLEYKLVGAKKAGVKKVLIPKENEQDLKEVLERYPNLIGTDFQVICVGNIQELLKHALEENDLFSA